jgi:tetratricopeptide (TPR) repeat protein
MKRGVMKARELVKIARLSLALGDSGYAIALLRHLLAHLPHYLEARLLLGNLLIERGELEEARRQGEVVLAVDPANYEALQGLRLLSHMRAPGLPSLEPVRSGTGRASLSRYPGPVLARPGLPGRGAGRGAATESDPLAGGGEGLRHRLVLAEALWRGARWREAKRLLAGLEERHPSCLRAKLMLADILLREGNEVAGACLLHEAQALDPSMKVARELFGGLHSDFLEMDVGIPLPEGLPPGPEELKVLLKGYGKEGIDVEEGGKEVPAGFLAEEEADQIPDVEEEAEPEAVIEPLEGRPDRAVAEEEEPVEVVDPLATEEWPHQLPTDEGKTEPEEAPGESVEESEIVVIPSLREDTPSLRPMELIVTSKFRLAEKYGPDGFMRIEERLSELERATKGLEVKRVYVDEGRTLDGLEPVDSTDPWAIKAFIDEIDERLRAEGKEAKFLLLVGGDDIIPFCRLPNPADDGELEVWTDNPYASRDDNFLLPQRAVGRIPDGKKEDILLSLLDVAIEGHKEKGRLTGMVAGLIRGLRRSPSSLGLSAEIWQEASQAVFEAIGNSKGLEISPPFTDQEFLERHTQVPPLAYFNLHGVKEAAYWYGHSSSGEEFDFPIALTPLNLAWAEVSGAVVYSEACYGAHLREGSTDSSIPLAFLAKGAKTVIGSTGMAYGSLMPPLSGADLLGRNLWLGLKRGFTIGEALLRAKLGLVEEMAERQGFLDGEDQKTILSFVLYGDPSLTAPIVASHSKQPSKAEISCPSVVCGMRVQDSIEVGEEVVAKVRKYLTEKAPFMAELKLKVASQSLCAKDCNCGGGCFLRQSPLGVKKAPPNLVFTSERLAPLPGDGTLKQIFRVTADQGGNVLKVAISK